MVQQPLGVSWSMCFPTICFFVVTLIYFDCLFLETNYSHHTELVEGVLQTMVEFETSIDPIHCLCTLLVALRMELENPKDVHLFNLQSSVRRFQKIGYP